MPNAAPAHPAHTPAHPPLTPARHTCLPRPPETSGGAPLRAVHTPCTLSCPRPLTPGAPLFPACATAHLPPQPTCLPRPQKLSGGAPPHTILLLPNAPALLSPLHTAANLPCQGSQCQALARLRAPQPPKTASCAPLHTRLHTPYTLHCPPLPHPCTPLPLTCSFLFTPSCTPPCTSTCTPLAHPTHPAAPPLRTCSCHQRSSQGRTMGDTKRLSH